MTTSTHETRPIRRRGGRLGRVLATGVATTALVLAAPLAASAHVHVDPGTAPAGGSADLGFSFSHGCDGSPTTGILVTAPEGIERMQPIAHPGWTIEADPSAGTVAFTAREPLPDGIRDTVRVRATLADDAEVGSTIAIPVVQTCTEGSYDWSGPADSDEPAPELTVGEPEADGHGHGSGHGSDHDHSHGSGHASGHDHGTDAELAAAEAEDAAEAQAAPATEAESSAAMPLAIGALVLAAVAAIIATIGLRRQSAGR